MKRAQSADLTEGPISQHFRNLGIPAAVGMVFNTLYNMVDIYFAGMLATSAQAGLAIGFMVFFIYVAFGFGLSAAISALIGSALGSKDPRKARRLVGQGLSFAILLSALLIVIGAWINPLIVEFVSEPGPYRVAANRYLLLLLLAVPGFLIAYTCNGILQAQGDSASLSRALIFAFFANVGLNPLLIYGIPGVWDGIGFDGLAVSTVLSQSGVMVYMAYRLFGSQAASGIRRSHLYPRRRTFRILVTQMLPTSFSLQIMIIAGFAVQYALKGFGGYAIAAYGVGMRIEQLLLLPVLGLTTSLLPIAAQNFGALKFDRLRGAVFFCVKAVLCFMALTCPLLWFGAPNAMRFFTDDPEVVRVGVSYLRVDGFLLPVYAMLFVVNSLLQALQRPIWVLWIGLYRQGFGVVFFVWVFIGPLGFDILGVWLGIGASVITGLILSLAIAIAVSRREIGGLW